MQCPACQVELRIADRQGIEIDYCPQCRGVWLDRGELDKLIERSTTFAAPPPPQASPQPHYSRERDDDDDDDRRYVHDPRYQRGQQRPRKRGGFLGELFDFD